MRAKLQARDGQRFRVRAFVDRSGLKNAWLGGFEETWLLRNLIDVKTGEVLDDHLWIMAGKWSMGISAGDTIEFNARVASYRKGYRGHRMDVDGPPPATDYHLTRPTKVVVLTQGEALPPALRCCRYYPDCAHVKPIADRA